MNLSDGGQANQPLIFRGHCAGWSARYYLVLSSIVLFAGCTNPLIKAVNISDVSSVKTLAPKASPDVKREALVYAVEKGDLRIVDALLDHGAAPTSETLMAAIRSAPQPGRVELVRLLVQKGAKPSVTVMLWGAKQQDLELLSELVAYGGDVNGHDTATILHVERGTDSVRLSNVKSKFGATPLSAAISVRDREAVDYLLNKGADPGRKFVSKRYQIHRVGGISPRTVNAMISKYDSFSIAGLGGIIDFDQTVISTPLGWAAQHGELEIAALLIAWGADIHAADSKGRTPLILATENSHDALAELLTKEPQ